MYYLILYLRYYLLLPTYKIEIFVGKKERTYGLWAHTGGRHIITKWREERKEIKEEERRRKGTKKRGESSSVES